MGCATGERRDLPQVHSVRIEGTRKVQEGDPTRISSVNIQGLDDLPDGDRKQLLEQVELKVGQIFIVERWDGLKEKLLHTLLEEGYAAATAQGEVKVGLDTHAAEVTVSVDHGPRYRFGAVSVKK